MTRPGAERTRQSWPVSARAKSRQRGGVAHVRIAEGPAGKGAGRLGQDEALVAARDLAEIEHREVRRLGEHQGDDQEGDAGRAQRGQRDEERQQRAGQRAEQEGGPGAPAGAPAGELGAEPGAVDAGGEEHGVAEAEQPGIAEGDVVAGGEDREHQDAGDVAVMVGGQQEGECRQKGEHGRVQRNVPTREAHERGRAQGGRFAHRWLAARLTRGASRKGPAA